MRRRDPVNRARRGIQGWRARRSPRAWDVHPSEFAQRSFYRLRRPACVARTSRCRSWIGAVRISSNPARHM